MDAHHVNNLIAMTSRITEIMGSRYDCVQTEPAPDIADEAKPDVAPELRRFVWLAPHECACEDCGQPAALVWIMLDAQAASVSVDLDAFDAEDMRGFAIIGWATTFCTFGVPVLVSAFHDDACWLVIAKRADSIAPLPVPAATE